MKICHFIASEGMGSGDFYIDLANELSKHTTIYLLVPKDANYKHAIAPAIEVVYYSAQKSRNNPLFLYEIYTKIKTINPDIVHTHFAKATEIFHLLNIFLNKVHIATKHNPRKGAIFNKIKYVIAVSQEVKASIKNTTAKLLYNGITPKEIPQTTNTQNNIFTLCAIGRLTKIKGFDLLIKEFSKLPFDALLNIFGEGEERANLEKLIHELGLERKVFLRGFSDDIPCELSKAHVCIVSSLSEGFSMVILESLFYSNLLISTPVGIAKEILDENFLVKEYQFADKIEEIYKNYSAFKESFDTFRLSTREKFLLKNSALDYIDYYKEALKNG